MGERGVGEFGRFVVEGCRGVLWSVLLSGGGMVSSAPPANRLSVVADITLTMGGYSLLGSGHGDPDLPYTTEVISLVRENGSFTEKKNGALSRVVTAVLVNRPRLLTTQWM